jgi:hypothetical protein
MADPLSTLATVINNVVKIPPVFPEYAITLIAMLTVIAMSWNGMKILLEGAAANEALAEIVKTFLIAGFAMAVIGTNSGGMKLGEELVKGFDKIASEVASGAARAGGGGAGANGNGLNTSTPGTVVEGTVKKMLEAASLIFIGKTQKQEAASPTVPSGDWIKDGISMVKSYGEMMASTIDKMPLTGIFTLWVSLAFKLALCCGLILATLAYVGQFIVTQIMLSIGMALMPIMVPFIILESTSFIFDGWMRFMITAGTQKIVGAMIFGLTTGALDGAVGLANQGFNAGDSGQMFLSYAVSFLIVGLLALLMMQTSSIANGLIGGRALGNWKPGKMPTASKTPKTGSGGKPPSKPPATPSSPSKSASKTP